MHVTVKCFATLDKFQPENSDRFPLSPGETVADLMDRLGVPRDEVHIIFVNNRGREADTVLEDGDRVGLFPAVGGG